MADTQLNQEQKVCLITDLLILKQKTLSLSNNVEAGAA